MTEAPSAPAATARGREKPTEPPCYGALDLGTNNCRLLIATPQPGGFRVIEAYSRIVRLGEGLASGRLSEAAMERAMAALKVSAEKLRRRRVLRLRAIAAGLPLAENGQTFIDESSPRRARLQIIPTGRPDCGGRLPEPYRPTSGCGLVVDVGGGSTELSWVDLKGAAHRHAAASPWLSVPIGVVTLAGGSPGATPPAGSAR